MIKLFLADLEVEMTDVINIPLNKTFEDLANPTNINNEFSKTIKVPVSVHNNNVLGHAFRLDRVVIEEAGNQNIGKWLNPTKKIPFRLLLNNDLIMEGYAKLSLADYSEYNRFYTINLFGTLGDLFHKLLNVAVTAKFCPELDITEIFDEDGNAYPYAVPFKKNTSEEEVKKEDALLHPGDYTWRDRRYLLNDYLSGERRVTAQYIKECWECQPVLEYKADTLDEIAKRKEDFRIVGFMPSHHGFPDNFDPKSYEFHNYNTNYNETGQFVDDLDKKSGYNTAPLVGDGLAEELLQQFVSWQLKPYIYINKLIALFQKHMENNPDVFNNFELEIDENWEAIDDSLGVYKNPYWSNLCYTFDFLFNQDIKVDNAPYDITSTDENGLLYEPKYRKIIIPGDKNQDTINLGLKTELRLNYEAEDTINAITLDGYACIAWPMNNHPLVVAPGGDNAAWSVNSQYAQDDSFAAIAMGDTYIFNSNVPQLFFTHYHNRAANRDVGYDNICNGGYRVTIDIFDRDNPNSESIMSITNAWYPKYLGDIKDYADEQTTKLWINSDGSEINGKKIDIVNETDKDLAAVLLHRSFTSADVDNSKLVEEYNNHETHYIAIGFPLRSFGSIPVGIRHPRFEVTIEAMSTYSNKITSPFNYCIGCYTNFDLRNNWRPSPCSLNVSLFPEVAEWTRQEDLENYTTMFFVKMDTSRDIVKYGTTSSDVNLNDWLSTDSNDKTPINLYNNGGLTWSNGYGRYSTLVTYDIKRLHQADAVLYPNAIDADIHFGQTIEQTFTSTVLMLDNRHSPLIKLENLWTKEESIFNILIEYSKIFGLFWDIDYIHKKLRLLSRFTYFENYTIEDWSDKVDYSKDFQITPILHSSKYLNFDYDDEKDAAHYSDYKQDYLVNYGGYRLKTGYDFTPDSEDLFKGVQSSCFSNRSILTYNQIANYRPEELPFVTRSPFTMLDADTKDMTKPIAIENWVFRNPNSDNLFTESEQSSNIWRSKRFLIIDDTPVMTATQKYMYIDTDIRINLGTDLIGEITYPVKEYSDIEYYYKNGYVVDGTNFPRFDIANGAYGCLFGAPMQDFTLPPVNPDGTEREKMTTLGDTAKVGKFIYDYSWRRWMDERYNINNKKLTCYIKLGPTEFQNITPAGETNDVYFANFKIINNQLYILNKIIDFNLDSTESVKCEFVQITDVNAYKDKDLITFPLFNIMDTTLLTSKSGNISHLPNITTAPQSWYTDYYYALTMASDQRGLSYRITCIPPYDTTIWISSYDLAASMYQKSLGFSKDILASDYSLQNNYDGLVYLLPYFTWFTSTNAGKEKEFDVVAKNSINNKASLTYAYKNIKAKFTGRMLGLPLGQELKLADHSYSVTLNNNLGLEPDVCFKNSFYEIPLLCRNLYDGQFEGDSKNFVMNVIIPTNNQCVSIRKSGDEDHDRFDHSNYFTIIPNQMYEGMRYNPWLENIKNDIKEKYGFDTVEILKDADGNTPNINLFTTVVWALDGNKYVMGVNSYEAFYNVKDGVPTIYAGTTPQSHSVILETQHLYRIELAAKKTPMFFGNGRYNIESGYFYDYDYEHTNIADTSGTYYYSSPVPQAMYYNTEATPGSITPILGKSRILDLYNYNTENNIPFPFLIDPDTEGEDGYVYATFYQPMLPDEGNLHVSGNFPTEADPTDYTKIGNITMGYVYGGKEQEDVLFEVSVYCTYDDASHGPSSYGAPYYNKNDQTLYITPNDTGSGRTIHFVVYVKNSNIKWETTIYQTSLIYGN